MSFFFFQSLLFSSENENRWSVRPVITKLNKILSKLDEAVPYSIRNDDAISLKKVPQMSCRSFKSLWSSQREVLFPSFLSPWQQFYAASVVFPKNHLSISSLLFLSFVHKVFKNNVCASQILSTKPQSSFKAATLVFPWEKSLSLSLSHSWVFPVESLLFSWGLSSTSKRVFHERDAMKNQSCLIQI